MKIVKIIIIQFLIGFTSFAFGQSNNDSLNIEVDSLLSIKVTKSSYVNSASKYSQTISESPLSSSVISIDRIRNYNYRNLFEALSSQSDLYTTNDLSYSNLGIRGFGIPSDYNNRLVALLDGHVLNERFYGSVNLFEMNLDPNMFENIEVIKGPGSLTYGTNAMFGIIGLNSINLESNPLPKLSVSIGYPSNINCNLQYSYNFFKDFNFQLFSGYKKVDGGNVYFPEFDSPETNNGIAENKNGEEAFSLYNT
jgi:iron complex outermembrane receptor protein